RDSREPWKLSSTQAGRTGQALHSGEHRMNHNRNRNRLVERFPMLLGRHLLDRRAFLSHMATGVGGIALSALMAQDGLLAAGQPGPESRPLAPKTPQFPAKAKRGLHIFCTREGR